MTKMWPKNWSAFPWIKTAFQEAHPKLRPVETFTAGVFLAGACQGPKDIPDTVSQASAAAVKVCQPLFSKMKWLPTP
jgi:heterodisulfide reductase subunit A